MPQANQFRHQAYTGTRPTSPRFRLAPGELPPVGSEAFQRRLQRVGAMLRDRHVAAVYLVHGSFVGPDAVAVLKGLRRTLPESVRSVRRLTQCVIEQLSGDDGNYTESYAHQFETGINRNASGYHVPVRLFHWSSENHHLGRADGAVRLIDELASLDLRPGQRVLLWGHSHAGNVFALMSNLLAGDREAVERFFRAAEVYYRWPILGCVDIPRWSRVRALLTRDHPALLETPLDMVTFGTPVRYGWDSAGYARLVHFIYRRAGSDWADPRASFPVTLEQVISAAEGDYVQQLGIAGTNVTPSIFSWRTRLADRRLQRLLQPEGPPEVLLESLRAGTIVPDEGTTLLVDYGEPRGTVAEHHAGHAVYTRKEWLLFHAEEVASRFYAAAMEEARQVA
jgi:hypothetical protein